MMNHTYCKTCGCELGGVGPTPSDEIEIAPPEPFVGQVPAGDGRTPDQVLADFRELAQGEGRGALWVRATIAAAGAKRFAQIPLETMCDFMAAE
jgi:hypothetical protein